MMHEWVITMRDWINNVKHYKSFRMSYKELLQLAAEELIMRRK